MSLIVVYNKSSGSARGLGELKRLFVQGGIPVDEYVSVDSDLEPFVKDGKTLAVVGGDGTISSVAGRMVGSDAVLAPLPGGTLNHFTKDLGIAQDLPAAIAALDGASSRAVDVGTVNGIVFLNNSSIGLYPSSLRDRRKIEKILGKWPALFFASVRTFIRLPGYEVTIGDESFRTPFVFVGNNEYKLDEPGTTSRNRIDEGVLSVFIAKKTSRISLLKIAFMALFGKAHLLDDFEVRKTPRLTIKTANARPSVSRDGEVGHMNTPLRYECLPGSLRILG